MKELLKRQKKLINSAICGVSPGFFTDPGWEGVHRVEHALDMVCQKNGLEWAHDQIVYEDDRKVWLFFVTDGQRTSHGVIVGSFAGTVQDPMNRYDVTAYIS